MANAYVPIGKLFNVQKGQLQSTKCTPGEYDFITAAEDWKTHDSFEYDCEALIFAAAASGSLGRTHYVDGKFISSDLCYVLKPKDEQTYPLNLAFYHFVFNSLRSVIVKTIKSGTSKESINQSNFNKFKLPYFHIEQQELWIGKLKATLTRKDLMVAEIECQRSLLKKLRHRIFQEAIEGKLTAEWRVKNRIVEPALTLLKRISSKKNQLILDKKIRAQKSLPKLSKTDMQYELPENWTWCRLDDVAYVGTGATPLTTEPTYYNGDISWMTSGDTGEDFVFETKTKITEKALSETNCKVYPAGTLVIAMYGQGKTRGQITELKIDAATNQACAAISIYEYSDSFNQFIKIHFKKVYDEIRKLAQGGAQPNLNMEKIRSSVIALPPLAEQEVIVSKVKKLLEICNQIEEQIANNQTNVEQLMQVVLKEAFNQDTQTSELADA